MKNRNKLPLVSIIVPVYKAEAYVATCIESIQAQTCTDWELILVDDGSTDDTLKICKTYAEKDQRIIIVPLEKNMGLINARKTGVEIAKAEYIGFVDSDDWIERDMYSNLINIQEKFDCDLISSGIYRDYIEEKYTSELVDNFQEGMYSNIPRDIYGTMLYDDKNKTFGIFCTLVNKLYRKNILQDVYKNIDTRVFYGEDCLTLFSYIMKISSLYILKKSYYHYNIRKTSMCGTADERLNTNTYYLYKGLEKEFINKKEYKYILLRQLKKYILGIELHTLDKLYNISAFSLGTYKYSYENLKNKKVVIYGAGNSSESLYNYLTKECKCDITGWVDKYPEGKDMKVMHEILAVNSILNIQYDYIVIAVLKKELADSIRKELIELYNIDSKKILWNKVEYVNLLDKM